MDRNDLEKLFGSIKKSASVGIKRMGEYGNVLKLKISIQEQRKRERRLLQDIGRTVFDAFAQDAAGSIGGNKGIIANIEEIKATHRAVSELAEEIEKLMKKSGDGPVP